MLSRVRGMEESRQEECTHNYEPSKMEILKTIIYFCAYFIFIYICSYKTQTHTHTHTLTVNGSRQKGNNEKSVNV